MYQQIFELQARILKALAHSRRLEIVQLLQDHEMSVSDIYQMLDLPQANVSQHLSVLKSSDILSTRKVGKQIYYQVTSPVFFTAIQFIRQFLIDKYQNTKLADKFTIQMNQLVPVTHDPVCRMRISPKTAGFAHKFHNRTYYFCASGCLKQFRDNPVKFIQN